MSTTGDLSAPNAMTVSQLARRTGVPPRRIRYYVSEELLPPPIGRGRASYYTAEHLERLQQIIALREVNLSLDEIREQLDQMHPVRQVQESSRPRSSNWRRWEVIPGVEMHASNELDEKTLATVELMVGAVRHVLEHGELPGQNGAEADE